ncbi:MAG: hypothetical protein ACI9KE_002955 [Polyangiales bacterium]|jgi:hypothetical protein
MRYGFPVGFLLFLAVGCSDDNDPFSDAGTSVDASVDASIDAPADAGPDAPVDPLTEVEAIMPDEPAIGGFAECTVTTARHITGRAGHITPCEPLSYGLSTPASGDHYSRWADFLRYEEPVPQGFLVHAMEHGAIIFQLGCGDDCGSLMETIDSLIEAHGDDPACGANGVSARFIVSPNPDLSEGAFAITAWEHVYLGTCVHEASMAAFIEAHYAQGPEDLCARGLDGEARGWCE